jgi:RimJ/RimL family protein N-acetyltransferase
MNAPPTKLQTERLVLRPPVLADAELIFESYAQDAEVTRYLIWPPHSKVETTRTFVQRCMAAWEQGSAFPWVIRLRAADTLIGMIELRVEGHIAELGYVLARPQWGMGYATEAAQAVVDWAIAQPEILRVWAVCDVDNAASARVLEKAGMQREGILRAYLLRPSFGDAPRDVYCYSIVKNTTSSA